MTTQTAMQFGTTLRSPFNVAEAAVNAETLGFDILGCGEHVMFHRDTANAFVSLAAAAGATTRIRLMSAITLVPLYPAALLAKMGAALDAVSNGRFTLGVGVGGEYPQEFQACGVPVSQRGSRTDDALEVIERVWTTKNVNYDGPYTKLEDFTLRPMPVQKPRPPIWVSGRKDVAMKRTARYADGWLPYMYTPEQLAASIEKIRQFASEFDRDLSDFKPGLYIFTAVHEDSKTAIATCTQALSTQYAQDFTKLVPKYALAGNPDQCKARLREYTDAGASVVILSSACPDQEVEQNLELIASAVIK